MPFFVKTVVGLTRSRKAGGGTSLYILFSAKAGKVRGVV